MTIKENNGKNTKTGFTACENQIYTKHVCNTHKRGLRSELTRAEYIELSRDHCIFCGTLGSNTIKVGKNYLTYNGIDRIDSNKGYLHGNVQTCCKLCNRMKSDLPQDIFLAHIAKIKAKNNMEVF